MHRPDPCRSSRVDGSFLSAENFACEFEIPKKGIAEYGVVQMNFKPLLATNSELVVVRYDLPFGLSAEPAGRVVRDPAQPGR